MSVAAEKDPQHLAIVAALAGAATPDVTKARVVDIACGDGEGLVASALALPGASFVGLDASEKKVDEARALAEAVGATNVRFAIGSLDAAEALDGSVDVVVADGVCASLDDAGVTRLFAWIARTLSPCGIAYVSFDAMPGARMLGVVRATLAHLTPDKLVRRELAAGLLAHFEVPLDAVEPAYAGMVRFKAAQLAQLLVASPEADALLDDLSGSEARAFYFEAIARRADDAGLAWIAEARTHDVLDEPLDPAAAELAASVAPNDPNAREQYTDFFRGRTFRRGVFGRKRGDATNALLPSTLHVATRVRVADGRMTNLQGVSIALSTDARALVDELASSAPETRPIDRARLVPDDPESRASLLVALQSGALRAFVTPPSICARVTARPRALALARERSRARLPASNAYGERVSLDDVGAAFLAELDGTRDLEALIEDLTRIGIERKILPPTGADRSKVAASANAMLAAFAAAGLMEA